jgi:hypothetical protein
MPRTSLWARPGIEGAIKPIQRYFACDDPNLTLTPNGRRVADRIFDRSPRGRQVIRRQRARHAVERYRPPRSSTNIGRFGTSRISRSGAARLRSTTTSTKLRPGGPAPRPNLPPFCGSSWTCHAPHVATERLRTIEMRRPGLIRPTTWTTRSSTSSGWPVCYGEAASQHRTTLSPTRHEDEVAVLLWDYAQDDVPGPDASVSLDLTEFPKTPRLLVGHCRIDGVHSNAYAV